MSNSTLVSCVKLSPNNSGARTRAIDRITIHHMAGVMTAEGCGAVFASKGRKASSNYGIGNDGRIGLYVDEDKRAWTSSSSANDNRAVTIEVSNSATGGTWPVSDAAYSALLDLVTDICRRNGRPKLLWLGQKDWSLAYVPRKDEMVLTVHQWFAATNCPGPYLLSRMGDIASEVTRRLSVKEEEQMTKEQILKELGDQYIERFDDLPDWAKPEVRELLDSGVINGGTGKSVDPDDINMLMSDIRTVIVSKRMLDKLKA